MARISGLGFKVEGWGPFKGLTVIGMCMRKV